MIIIMKRIAIVLGVTLSCQLAPAGDWPEWRGRGGLGVWKETGILDAFPKEGLAVKWRTPINAGFTDISNLTGNGDLLNVLRQIQFALKLYFETIPPTLTGPR